MILLYMYCVHLKFLYNFQFGPTASIRIPLFPKYTALSRLSRHLWLKTACLSENIERRIEQTKYFYQMSIHQRLVNKKMLLVQSCA